MYAQTLINTDVEWQWFFMEQAERARQLRIGQTMQIWIDDIQIAFVNLTNRKRERLFIAMNDDYEWYHTTDTADALTALVNALEV